jgi:hypothetical protein
MILESLLRDSPLSRQPPPGRLKSYFNTHYCVAKAPPNILQARIYRPSTKSRSDLHGVMEHSPLARLPRELRDQVTDNLLPFPDGRISLHSIGSKEAALSIPLERSGNEGFFELILTCRQMHIEAAQRLYGNHTFSITGNQRLPLHETFEKFTSMIGSSNAADLRSIELCYLLLELNNYKFAHSLEKIMRTANSFRRCSVTVIVTHIGHRSPAVRARLVLDKMFEPNDAWIESLKSITGVTSSGVQDVTPLDRSIELLRTHLRECKAYIRTRHALDSPTMQPLGTTFSGIFASIRRVIQNGL